MSSFIVENVIYVDNFFAITTTTYEVIASFMQWYGAFLQLLALIILKNAGALLSQEKQCELSKNMESKNVCCTWPL